MSNSHLFMTSGFPRAPLRNGIGRYICQLKRVTLKFCKTKGDSKGIRDFIGSHLLGFAQANPGVVVYLKPRRFKSPHIVAEYLNGRTDYINCHDMTKEEVFKSLTQMVNQSKREVMLYRKLWHTDCPSIQGTWSPFTFSDPKLNLAVFSSVIKFIVSIFLFVCDI
ncbi:hypothetical protein AAG570_003276 [Ranatra chinensis]|uniref:Large ribosomal subunit protein mL43 n=1 Tax=Ranatra chinensis TaxID=642074 RepID=A0ABD0Y6C3_9HEMI